MSHFDFAALSLKDALDLAILVEDEAEERYREFTEQMTVHHSAEAATFFDFMADNEKKHGNLLRSRRRSLFADAESEVDRSMLWNAEAPEYSEARAFMSARQALEVALEAETKAFDFFNDALPTIGDATVRELFAELRQEEIEHQEMVKRVMAKLDEGREVDPADYVDPPIGM